MKISDEELLKELKDRFNQQKTLIESQKTLVKDLEDVNKKLIQSEKIKSDFLSNIKNEINNPITSMLGLLKVVKNNPNSEKNINLTHLIYKEAFTLNFHLQNVFFAAEIEAGHMSPNPTHVDVNKLVKDQINALSEVYSDKSLQVDFSSSLVEPFICDRSNLDVIVANLVSNAIKFSHNEEKIKIEVKKKDNGQLWMVIEDYGIGMEPASIKRAFDRFVQLDTGTTKNYGGHGLGLSVVQSLLEFMEGNIEVTSELNRGTRIDFILPESHANDDDDLFDGDDEFLFNDDDSVDIF